VELDRQRVAMFTRQADEIEQRTRRLAELSRKALRQEASADERAELERLLGEPSSS